MSIILYGRHTSYNVQKILWFADELALEYRHIELGSRPSDTESDEFGLLNPMRKVPVLVENDRVIWESNTILRYLARAHGSEQWQHKDAFQASLVERWMDWAQTRFEPAFIGVFWGYYRTPEENRDMSTVNTSLDDCLYCLSKLDEQLATMQFLSGDQLSLADITTGVFLYRLAEIDLNVILPDRVQIWYQHLQQSTAYQRWVMSDFSSLQERLQY